ncbi:hypothetical protein NLJ89_g348 [Agrocybe chaxingu]|uniref:Polyketide synthase-like phosphopantetheine-binding domain-containing protein n=1 Tax=Agrocybe chaxingu TaxID=84603 RepID=A0A9W8N234_9AGAR|nr:hypothetical protein NLJ89_g348 [Agrocybe chaxingu]
MSLYAREFVYPPIDGSITLPETIDFHWTHNADLPIYAFHDAINGVVKEISLLEFGRACHRVAHELAPNFEVESRPVVALMALSDSLLYQAVTVGLMKAGVVPFPISSRNTAVAIANLLRKTSCHYLVTTSTTLRELIDEIKNDLTLNEPAFTLIVLEVPPLCKIFPKLGEEYEEDPFTPYTASPKPKLDEVGMYIHSSGSTGFPKAIPQTHWTLVNWAAMPPTLSFRDRVPRIRMAAMHLPPFHTLGIYAHLLWTLYGCTTMGLYPPVVESSEMVPILPTPDNILEHLRNTNSNCIITIPTLLQIWAQDPKAVDTLSKLEFVSYSGGAVVPRLGDFMVAEGVTLNPGYGGTEFGSPTYPFKRKEDASDWEYMEFDERCKIRWAPQGDGTFECQFLTNDNHPLPIENLPDARGYATSDLFEPHPTKKHLWKIVGRLDDVIVHSSGEKTVPAPMEDIIMSSNYVMGVVMFGQSHGQPGVLMEPKPTYAIDVNDENQVAKFRNLIWPIVDEANRAGPAFSRIFKEMTLLTNKDKPLPRSGKGTVMRKLAVKVYADEIEALYNTVESTQTIGNVEAPTEWDVESVTQWIVAQLQDLLHGKTVQPTEDLFEQGLDSATILRRRIAAALQSTNAPSNAIAQNTIYTYPTLERLADHVAGLINGSSSMAAQPEVDLIHERINLIESMISKYQLKPVAGTSSDASKVVLLTGSTGNLGAQILASLLKDARARKIYALDRPSRASGKSILERHKEKFADKRLDVSLLMDEKLIFIEGELAKDRLGLSEEHYEELQLSVNVIIHTAWRLDFNLSLVSFESSIRGAHNLLQLARTSRTHAHRIIGPEAFRFIFTSSVASALSWNQALGPYPEEVVLDSSSAVGNGYGESKYVAERVLASSGLNATSLRIGQISGGLPNGAWATTDWVPILVKSSLALGALPLASGVVSWLPMDAVSDSILDLAMDPDARTLPPVMNVLHPSPVPWNTIIEHTARALSQELSLDKPLNLVPFRDWFSMLEARQASSVDQDISNELPAVKLRDFFKAMANTECSEDAEVGGLTRFTVRKIQDFSETMKNVRQLEYEDVERWVRPVALLDRLMSSPQQLEFHESTKAPLI